MSKLLIVLVTQKDGTATQARTQKISNYLKSKYLIKIIDARHLIRRHFLSSPLTVTSYLIKRLLSKFLPIDPPLIQSMEIQAKVLNSMIQPLKPSCLICGVEETMLILHYPFPHTLKIYDFPTPYADEIKYSHRYSNKTIKALEKLEANTINQSDYFCGNWPTYTKYVAQKYKRTNYLTASSGCDKPKLVAKYSSSPRIAFVGNLDGYWTNISLLKHLCLQSNYPIHVYAPQSRQVKELPYYGYLYKHDKLSTYQFGLITISEDPLRQNGFSAKHLLYISYGLPVLCPEWRHDPVLGPATISYNSHNFNEIVNKYHHPKLWQEKHQAALTLRRQLAWDKTLKPLLDAINGNLID